LRIAVWTGDARDTRPEAELVNLELLLQNDRLEGFSVAAIRSLR
jgi:hypothetical protein